LIRLIGVKFSQLITGAYQTDLFDDTLPEMSLSQAMDKIRMRYGHQSIKRGFSIYKHFGMFLNLHSYYSLRYGTMSIQALIESLRAFGYDTAVLTDINNSSATLDYIKQCRASGINGLAGMEFRNNHQLLYVGIAKNEEGFKELND